MARTVLVKVEYHGQIWFETKEIRQATSAYRRPETRNSQTIGSFEKPQGSSFQQ